MSVADKLLQLNQVKQDIKTAIETKGVDMTDVAFTEYANKILEISGGGVEVDEYFYYSKTYYTITNNATLFEDAWQDMKDSKTVLFDIPLELVAPNQDIGGFIVDLYVGTDDQLQALYDACASGAIRPPIDLGNYDTYYVNNVATFYAGDVSGEVSFPIPLYCFGNFLNYEDNTAFLIGDLTPLSMGLGLVLIKNDSVSIPNNNIVIQQGFEFENDGGIIIPNSVTSIGEYAFYNWKSNNQPLVIPNSVTSIGESAFQNWESNNQPLVIPNSVSYIDFYAFSNWTSNNQPLVIPDSVTSIGWGAFYNWESNDQPLIIPNSVTFIDFHAFSGWELVPYVEIQAITPPLLVHEDAFDNQNDAPIYVPDESVEAYKTAPDWVSLADRIFSINDK